MIQQATFEYLVTGSVDGTTAPPDFSVDPRSPIYKAPDSANIYTWTVTNLGLLEVGFMNALASGYRLITTFWLASLLPGAANAVIELVATNGLDRLGQVADLADLRSLYRKGIFIPQGCRLRVNGFTGSAANPVRIRYNVVVPAVDEEFADLQRADRFEPFT